jgi:hypothetical protein
LVTYGHWGKSHHITRRAISLREPSLWGNVGRAEIAAKSEDAFFLRDSPRMVVMKNGNAVDLVLCKGY